ncbi:MAG TPA: type IV toxin-antitoxin system AbiEi family antitoxin domain-containing protein [Gaiellaceae bacterium]|nr:type IV toxin-antitoxin system AbiEi family antitoxin domain-containing protein [Gaiellaceae bacterium]
MALKATYRRRLHERALDQYGYVTTRDADDLGVPPVELRKLHQRGGLEHVGQGLYRFEDIPPTARDGFMEAVLRVGEGALLAGDAVLALHELGSAHPRRVRVATPRRVRRRLPPFIEVEQRDVPPAMRTMYEGIPAMTVAEAIRDCRGMLMPERLVDAVVEAVRAGLIRKAEATRLVEELELSRSARQ